jgi:hypothetical protein
MNCDQWDGDWGTLNSQRFESTVNPQIVGMLLPAEKNQFPPLSLGISGGEEIELDSRLVQTDVLPAGSEQARSFSFALVCNFFHTSEMRF